MIEEVLPTEAAEGFGSWVSGFGQKGSGSGSGSFPGQDPRPNTQNPSRKGLGYGNLSSLRPLPGRCQRRLCGFEREGAEWVATPRVIFRPSALMLWDVPERATISHSVAGNQIQIAVSSAPVPARFFATGHSFEQIVRRFEREGIDAPYWCDFDTLDLGKRPALRKDADESVVPLNESTPGAVAEKVMKKFEVDLDPKNTESLASVIKRYILAVFEEFDGNKAKTAEALGIGRTTIYRKLGLRKD